MDLKSSLCDSKFQVSLCFTSYLKNIELEIRPSLTFYVLEQATTSLSQFSHKQDKRVR